ncbi:MAG: hypothetical protein ACRETA_12225, partial [Gammaproteobacteria bacterium]
RKALKVMLAEWERKFPGRNNSIFAALQNVTLSHLADPKQFDFAALGARQVPQHEWLGADSTDETEEDVLVATISVDELLKTTPRGRVASGDV